jgi:hypothetical protein
MHKEDSLNTRSDLSIHEIKPKFPEYEILKLEKKIIIIENSDESSLVIMINTNTSGGFINSTFSYNGEIVNGCGYITKNGSIFFIKQ